MYSVDHKQRVSFFSTTLSNLKQYEWLCTYSTAVEFWTSL